MALVLEVWRFSFSCCDKVAKLGLGFQPLVYRQRSVDYKLLIPVRHPKSPIQTVPAYIFAHCNLHSGFFSVRNGNN